MSAKDISRGDVRKETVCQEKMGQAVVKRLKIPLSVGGQKKPGGCKGEDSNTEEKKTTASFSREGRRGWETRNPGGAKKSSNKGAEKNWGGNRPKGQWVGKEVGGTLMKEERV